ncbi:hypothetical protein [Lentzea terrae]|uniref:hypothetical protein n=1 Tax=Lentzea terrae TaxID=2200761 RepID=UPI001E37E923|nr:hypothetical protein [Lentzea terrae]
MRAAVELGAFARFDSLQLYGRDPAGAQDTRVGSGYTTSRYLEPGAAHVSLPVRVLVVENASSPGGAG